MNYIFSNVYRFNNNEDFQKQCLDLQFCQNDTLIFLNECVPLVKNINFFTEICKSTIIAVHRKKESTGIYFGYEKIKQLNIKNLVQYLLDDTGLLTTDNNLYKININIGHDYPKKQIPTTGFYVYKYFKQLQKPFRLVNFYGNKDASTGKWKGHDWSYEDNQLQFEYDKKIYLPFLLCDTYIVEQYLTWLKTNIKNCRITHFIIDDQLLNKKTEYQKTIDYLKNKLQNSFYLNNISRYDNCPNNTHHWTTDYVWTTVFPLMSKILGFKYNENDFSLIKNIDNKYDFSYHLCNKKINYEFINLLTSYKRTGDHNILRCKAKARSKYHELYAGNHSVSMIINKSIQSGIRLIINCDSMSIPLIPLLAPYCEKILILDNRTKKQYKDIIDAFCPTNYLALGLVRQFCDNSFDKTLPSYISSSNNKILSQNLI